jgi:hypothetical protein
MKRPPVPVLRKDVPYLEEIRPGLAASLERRGLVKIVDTNPTTGKAA